MDLSYETLNLINSGVQNHCTVKGLTDNGIEKSAEAWLTDEQVENLCGTSYGDFKVVCRVSVRTRFYSSGELCRLSERQISAALNSDSVFQIPHVSLN